MADTMPLSPAQKAAATRRRNREQADRMKAIYAANLAIVLTGHCPDCGSKLRRNLSLTGWWQCEQLGAVTHRKRPADPPCEWQAFVA